MKGKNTIAKEAPQVEQEGRDKPEFISVPVEVLGKHKGKNYVALKGLAYNPEKGNLSLHLSDNHTLLFKSNFQKDYMKVVLKPAEKIELAAKSAPTFQNAVSEKSPARMRVLGEREGRTFVAPTGSVKYDGTVRGLVVNLDDKHMTIVDSQMLSKELGLTVSPIAMEKNLGLSR